MPAGDFEPAESLLREHGRGLYVDGGSSARLRFYRLPAVQGTLP